MISDIALSAEVAASSWEQMAAASAAHHARLVDDLRRAQLEYAAAVREAVDLPGVMADIRLGVALVALRRAEGRLQP